MATLVPHRVYTIEEYVQLEQYSNTKHELYAGQIFAMSGGTPEHGVHATNVIQILGRQLAGKKCRVQNSDVRIRVQATGLDTYPGVSVVCGHAEIDRDDRNAIVNPVVLVEVTSPSTDAYDRGEKLACYQQIASLHEVVFVAHEMRRIDVVRRLPDGTWTTISTGAGETARLDSLGCTLEVDEVYLDPLA